MPRLSVVVLAALLGATLALPAAAQWKWRDKGGQIQYSDLPPPPGISDQDILQRPAAAVRRASTVAAAASAAPSASATAKPVEPELEAKRRKAEQEQASKTKADEEKVAASRADNCVRAKGYMRTLDEGVRISRTNEKGEREFLDDTQRAAEVKRTREVITNDCK